jgi:regulator of extracellular matrix RemA (YlzA/DUF370 family)
MDAVIPKRRRNRQSRVPLEQMLVLKDKGLNSTQIAKICDCTPGLVKNKCRSVGITFDGHAIQEYRKKRSDLIVDKEKLLLEAITPEKIAVANLREIATAVGILYDKSRLEDGKATQHVVTYAHILKEKTESEDLVKAIEAEILSREENGQ